MMQKNDIPLVSVITVCYNAEKTIERTILSVIRQTYQNIEYIIVDGQSTDSTLSIIEKFESNIDIIISESDTGIYDAMNKGILRASGQLIGILNADDYYEIDAIQNVVLNSNINPSASVFHGILRTVDKNEQAISICGHSSSFLSQGMIEHPTCFVKREVYRDYGGFDSSLIAVGDYDYMLNLKKKGVTFFFIDKILTNFSVGGITGSKASRLEELKIKRKFKLISQLQYWMWTLIITLLFIRKKMKNE